MNYFLNLSDSVIAYYLADVVSLQDMKKCWCRAVLVEGTCLEYVMGGWPQAIQALHFLLHQKLQSMDSGHYGHHIW